MKDSNPTLRSTTPSYKLRRLRVNKCILVFIQLTIAQNFFIQIIYFYSNTLILKILFVLNYIPFMTGMYNF